MWLQMVVGYYLKGRPEKYIGLTHESITYCKGKGVAFSTLMAVLFKDMLGWYMRFVPPAELNGQLDKFRDIIKDVKVVEEQPVYGKKSDDLSPQ